MKTQWYDDQNEKGEEWKRNGMMNEMQKEE